jgi:DNA-binding beta-propeller fold protein YncE
VRTLVGGLGTGGEDDEGPDATFNEPSGIAVASGGAFAIVADRATHTIRKIDLATGWVTSLAGTGSAGWYLPCRSMVSPVPFNDSYLLGCAGFVDETGAAAAFNDPKQVTIDPTDTYVLVTDSENHRIRKVLVSTGEVATIAGSQLGSAGKLQMLKLSS